MGEMILFRLREGRSRRASAAAAQAGAQIVFFTGVRYERMPDAVAVAQDTAMPPADGPKGLGRPKRRRRAAANSAPSTKGSLSRAT